MEIKNINNETVCTEQLPTRNCLESTNYNFTSTLDITKEDCLQDKYLLTAYAKNSIGQSSTEYWEPIGKSS